MTKTKVKIFKAIYHFLNLIIAFAICYVGMLVLNTDLITSIDLPKLTTFIAIALATILGNGILSYKLHQTE